ncbi:hypothetical protein QTP88_018322 [Uroleucon formosanum]
MHDELIHNISDPHIFQSKLSEYIISSRIPRRSATKLLKLLKSVDTLDCLKSLPKDSRTLLYTPRSGQVNLTKIRGGEYVHFGISTGLLHILKHFIPVENLSILHLWFNIDGLPIYKKGKSFWPILCAICFESIMKPFIVGVYFRSKKPYNIQEYLYPFVEELNYLLEHGLVINDNTININIKGIIADAPARAFIKQVKGHSGYFACEKCIEEGIYLPGSISFPNGTAELRTDESFDSHSNEEHHIGGIIGGISFLMKQKKENRLNLLPIIKCVMLCGRQELALRGHKDAGPICFKTESEPYINEGNFRAILKYKAKDLNHLKHFLESDGRYKYTSAKIQNEIISSAGDILLEKIVRADETTDISVKEQLVLCVRYVVGSDENVFVCERFLKYIEIHSLTGKDIPSTIVNGLNSCGIDCSNMYGQGYDGASNMSGRFKGTQKIVRETCPKALYVHCAAHSLNLAVSTSCDIQAIRNSLGLVEKMYCFLNTPKRKNVLLSVINESDMDTRSKSIKHLCATRWVERYTAINDFVELFPYVIQTLEKICEWNDTTSTDANILMKAMDSEFLISLQVIKVLFSYGLPLCKLLQKVNLDLKEAVDLAEVTVATIQRLRGNITEGFKQLFKEAELMIIKYNII